MKLGNKVCMVILSIMLVLSFSLSAAAKEPVTVSLVSAPFGTGQYSLATAIENISRKNHPWLRVSVTESPGLVYNIKKMELDPQFKKDTITICDDTMLWFAHEGKAPLPKPMGKDVKILAYSHGPVVWLASLNPDIKKLKDLAGKKAAIGTKAQITWGLLINWVVDIGAGLKGKVDYQWVGLEPARRAVLDGMADAMPVGVYLNTVDYQNTLNGQTRELLASRKKIYHLSVPQKDTTRMSKALNHEFKSVVIPAGKMQGIDQEIRGVWGGGNFWCVSEKFSEDLAYEFTKLLIDNCGKLKDYHALGALTARPEVLCEGTTPKTLHPGAYRAYKEAGLMK